MPVVRVDLSEAKSFEPLPEGAYLVAVTGVEAKQSVAGEGMLNWTLTVQDGEFTGRKVWLNTMTEGKGAFRLVQLLDAVYQAPEGEQIDLDPQDVIGCELTVTVKQRPYEDRIQNEVVKMIAIPCKAK